jgi:hypothetical protein
MEARSWNFSSPAASRIFIGLHSHPTHRDRWQTFFLKRTFDPNQYVIRRQTPSLEALGARVEHPADLDIVGNCPARSGSDNFSLTQFPDELDGKTSHSRRLTPLESAKTHSGKKSFAAKVCK